MPKLRSKGLAAIQSSEAGGGGRKASTFTPLFFISKKEGQPDHKYVLFVTPMEEVEKVWLHTFVKVPNERKPGTTSWEVFASRTRNPEFGDEESFLEKELRHQPQNKVAAIAVDLEPVYEGGKALSNITHFDVITGEGKPNDDGEVPVYPRWNLIHEAAQTFWAEAMFVYDDNGSINDTPLRIKKGDQGAWNFKEINVPVFLEGKEVTAKDLQDHDFIPSLEDEIKRLGSKERFDHFFGGGLEIIKNQGQRFQSDWWLEEMGFKSEEEDEEEEAPKPKRRPASKTATSKRKVSVDDLDKMVGIDEDDEGGEEAPY